MMSVILGYAQMALEKTDPGSELHGDLQEIFDAGVRSANITRQLLAFARKQIINPQALDLNEIVEGMLKMLRRLIGEDINLVWRPASDLWPVKIDPSQMDQILANLCVNARDAIPGVGKVTIETGMIAEGALHCAHHHGAIPGEYVFFSVSDDGSGMEKEILAKLFEPFFTTKEIGKGTGLGLATVYGIVKQNNGYIDVCSEPGKGTTFKIYLPRYTETTIVVVAEVKRKIQPGHGETILVAEDEVALLRLTSAILKNGGYNVLTASTPKQAIRLVEEQPGGIHLLIVDAIMPEMNGRDLANLLFSMSPQLKCLFMSGYPASVIADQNVLAPDVNFLQKPFSAEVLMNKVGEVLSSETIA